MISYEMEELLPVVAELSRKYTAGESTSISYEKARQLMEAVIYCIQETETGNGIAAEPHCQRENGNGAAEVYRMGREAVLRKVKVTQEKYNRLAFEFCDYGNENLRDTMMVAIPGFFKYYDPVFAPQNTIITMDYPVLNRDISLQGIDAVAAYLDAIELEQFFLGRIRTDIVCRILQEFDEDYRMQFYNISSVVMRYMVTDMLIGKRLGDTAGEEEYCRVRDIIRKKDGMELQGMLLEQLQRLVQKQYAEKEQLTGYFEKDIRELSVQLKNIPETKNLRNVVVL